MKKSEFQFSNPYIKESVFKLNDNFKFNNDELIKMTTDVKLYEVFVNKENRCAKTGIEVAVGEESSEYPFFINIKMEAEFMWTDTIKMDIDELLKINAPSLLLGYVRPIVSLLTANSPYTAYHLPFINFALKKRKNN